MPEPSLPDLERLAAMRRGYRLGGLREEELAPTWLAQLRRWLDEVEAAGIQEPNAMVLATADAGGRPNARLVLLKGLDDDGLVFFTNYRSVKGRELATNPIASVVFPWTDLQRQVRATGPVRLLDPAASDRYFASRPHGSQLSAAASPQSEVIASRDELEAAVAALTARHPPGSAVPRPGWWGGYVLAPDEVEFWQGRPDRLHDRLAYRRTAGGSWIVQRLAP